MAELFIENSTSDEFKEKRVIEVGSRYVNGSVRSFVEKFLQPREYVGVDIEMGKCVDMIVPAERLIDEFGEESFDILISTELLEHVSDWRNVIGNFKRILKKDGLLFLTTRSIGFPYHAFPYDFWRFEIEDFQKIFSDFDIIVLERDLMSPGVFLKARRPKDSPGSTDLSKFELHSMVLEKRTVRIPSTDEMRLLRRVCIKHPVVDVIQMVDNIVQSIRR
ncbi:MAG: class I SAM-dependent methyltransferase [Thermoplasmata archaeon]|nr:class I SAM-dependent methyltransferase [Thermoplasmata archaeon]